MVPGHSGLSGMTMLAIRPGTMISPGIGLTRRVPGIEGVGG